MPKKLNLRDKIKKRIEQKKIEQQMGGNYLKLPSNIELFKPTAGVVVFDVIPYKVKNNPLAYVDAGDYWYERTFYVHGGIGVDNKSHLCLKSFGQKCPICEYRQKLLKQASSDDDFSLAKGLKPRERQLFLIWNVKEKKYQILELSYHLFGKKLEEEINEGDEDWADFAEIEGGKTLRVRFSERKLGQFSFVEATRIDFVDRKHKVKLLKLSLDDVLNPLPYEQLSKVFFEGLPDDGGDDEELEIEDYELENEQEEEPEIEESKVDEPEIEESKVDEPEIEGVESEKDEVESGDFDDWEDEDL